MNELNINIHDNFSSKIYSVLGLFHLHNQQYEEALNNFLKVQANMGDQFSTLIHIEEIALYIILCALATMDRKTLKEEILQSSSTKAILEYQPTLREVVQDIINSKYSQALQMLERNKIEYTFDIFIGEHISDLYHRIQCKAISQYLLPYTVVNLPTMSNALHINQQELQELIVELIKNQTVSGRIDARSQTFRQYSIDPRNSAIDQVLLVGKQFINESHGLLLKESLKKHNLMVRKPTQDSHPSSSRFPGSGTTLRSEAGSNENTEENSMQEEGGGGNEIPLSEEGVGPDAMEEEDSTNALYALTGLTTTGSNNLISDITIVDNDTIRQYDFLYAPHTIRHVGNTGGNTSISSSSSSSQ